MATLLFCVCVYIALNVVTSRVCEVNNTITRGFEMLTDDINTLLVRINNRKSNCDQFGGTYLFDASTGVIGDRKVNFNDYTIVDWATLTSQNVVSYNQNTNEVTINTVTTTLQQIPSEWAQFYSQSLDLLYVILRNTTRAASNGYVWVYSFDVTNNNWNRININSKTFNYLLNEEFLNDATWTGTLTEFDGSPIIDKYKVVSIGGYYKYNTNVFEFINEFCCTKIDERTSANRMYESYENAIKITTFKDDGSGNVESNVTYTYSQQDLERDIATKYQFVSALIISIVGLCII
eukprot:217622_1